MASSTDPQRAAQWFRPGYPAQHVRVSDADRSDVADRLARHYGDGRLDQAEFDDRISRAMAAKTVGDFQGLFDDLPELPPDVTDSAGQAPGSPPAAGYPAIQRQRGRRRGPIRTLLLIALIFMAVSIGWHAVTDWWFHPLPWIFAAIVIVVLASRASRRSR